MGSLGLTEVLVIVFIIGCLAAVAVLPFWMIFSKAGFPGWLSLTQLIPLVNVIALFYLAFAEWPALRDVTKQ
jgi:hypothetical protein